ncbi:uncharacterized protein METZ01_LOCUS403592, partial [marine metagenome]
QHSFAKPPLKTLRSQILSRKDSRNLSKKIKRLN